MELWKSIGGMVEVELTSAEPEAALAAVNAREIEIFHMQQVSDLTCRFRVRRKDYVKLIALCEKRGETLKLLRKTGSYWAGKDLIRRPVLLAGMVFLMIMMFYLPSRVFFVRVEGNLTIPTRKILAAAEESGITFGASRREVRSEKVKNALLSAVPELQWAGVNTAGCVATISVREKTVTEAAEEKWEVTSIIAARDGYVLSATVTKGNAMVQAGQTVKEGQVLVSGYTDCGICIQATRSEGEILAQTNRQLEAVTLSDYILRDEIREIKKKYSLLLRKKRINLWKDSGILEGSCGRMYKEYYITLPGGFQLPIALYVESYIYYVEETAETEQAEAEEALGGFAEKYLLRQMVAGEIRSKAQTVCLDEGIYRLTGNYVCTEMIGKVQREQIGDTNGKSG